MTWWEAILWTIAGLAFWPVYAVVGEVADRAFQRRMDATLWRSLKLWER
jgi:hypothetical protein